MGWYNFTAWALNPLKTPRYPHLSAPPAIISSVSSGVGLVAGKYYFFYTMWTSYTMVYIGIGCTIVWT